MNNEKLTKSVIKQIVKECLVEILSEGIGKSASLPAKKQTYSPRKIKEAKQKRKIYEESLDYGEIPSMPKRRPKINTNITNDSVLNEILADTAKNTLQEQLAAENRKNMVTVASQGDNAARTVANSNPEDIFGNEAASKWSQLAFFDSK